MHIAQFVKYLRKQHGLTQAQLAERLHLSINGYTNLERGKSQFNEKRLQQIATVFGLSYHQFLVLLSERPTPNAQRPTPKKMIMLALLNVN